MQIAVALALTLISACALNLGYLYQHGAASGVPPLSLRRPYRAEFRVALRARLSRADARDGMGRQDRHDDDVRCAVDYDRGVTSR